MNDEELEDLAFFEKQQNMQRNKQYIQEDRPLSVQKDHGEPVDTSADFLITWNSSSESSIHIGPFLSERILLIEVEKRSVSSLKNNQILMIETIGELCVCFTPWSSLMLFSSLSSPLRFVWLHCSAP